MKRTEKIIHEDARLVSIVTLEGDDFDAVVDFPDEDLTEYLAQWDFGDENDGAATVNGYTDIEDAKRFGAETVEHGGLTYWRTVDRDLRMVSLMRKPLVSAASAALIPNETPED